MLLKRQVIDPNIEELKAQASKFRDAGKQIIEPGSFESPSRLWSQLEFYRFWEGVITEHANDVVFLDGWHLSVGCTYEFLCAVRAGKSTQSASGDKLDAPAAVKLINESATEFSGSSSKLEKHWLRLNSMKEAISFAHEERMQS